MKKIKNTLWISGCFLLVGVNVAFFLLFPHLASGIAIVLSNVITVLLTFLAFKPINDWNRAHIWQYGHLYRPGELFEKAAGEPFDPTVYTDYLEQKFTALYGM